MFKKGLITAIGKANYIHYVTFVTDLYQSACVPFRPKCGIRAKTGHNDLTKLRQRAV